MFAASWKLHVAILLAVLLVSCSTPSTKPAKAISQIPGSIVEQPNLQAHDDSVIPPEVVRSEEVHIGNGEKLLTVGNANGHYLLSCATKADGCITPAPNKNYLLFTKTTHWKMPGAQDFMNLKFLQDWTVTYKEAENIGLVPEVGSGQPDELGMYRLRSWSRNR